jgi:hypothetical protein
VLVPEAAVVAVGALEKMTGPEKFAGPVKLGVAAEKPPEETNDPEKVAGPVKFGVAAVKPVTFKLPALDIDVTTTLLEFLNSTKLGVAPCFGNE